MELEGEGEAWLLGKTFPILAEDVMGTIIEPPTQGPGLIKVENDEHDDTVFFMVRKELLFQLSTMFLARCPAIFTPRRS